MNPTQTSPQNTVSSENLLERAFENNSLSPQTPPIEEAELITHSDEAKAEIKNSWSEFYSMRSTEITQPTPESPVNKVEITETKVEYQFTEKANTAEKTESKTETKPVYVIEEQKGSGSWVEDAGFKLDFKSLFKGVFSFFGSLAKDTFKATVLVKEITMDTVTLVVGKKDKKAEKVDPDPAKAEAAAKKKAEQQRKNTNIRAFYEGLKAQMSSTVSVEAVRMETQEKENINKTLKLTNTAYKGVKDSFGRLTVYAASMFEREQLDEERKMKKVEKEQKMASATGKPDLNMDKVAEGGFLSSTGGQGAG